MCAIETKEDYCIDAGNRTSLVHDINKVTDCVNSSYLEEGTFYNTRIFNECSFPENKSL